MRWLQLTALVVLATSCAERSPDTGAKRVRIRGSIEPQAVALLDRNTVTRSSFTSDETLTIRLEESAQIRSIRLFGLIDATLSLNDVPVDAPSKEGWQSVPFALSVTGAVTLRLFPKKGQEGSLAEVEFWGDSRAPSVAESPAPSAAGSNVVLLSSKGNAIALSPRGTEGSHCGEFEFPHDVSRYDVRRAWLRVTAPTLTRIESLKTSLNSAPLREAVWMEASGTPGELAEELDPRLLLGGTEVIHFCLPDTATRGVTIERVELALAVDDGTHWFSREAVAQGPPAFDGIPETGQSLTAATRDFLLERLVLVDRVTLAADSSKSEIAMALSDESSSSSVAVPLSAENFPLESRTVTRLSFEGAAAGERPLLFLKELSLRGSPIGGPATPGLVLSMPAKQRRDAAGIHLSYVGGQALLAGWAVDARGPGRVFLGEAEISSASGAFSAVLQRPPSTATWSMPITMRWADESKKTETLIFDLDEATSSDAVVIGTDATLFGAENETSRATIGASGGEVRLGQRVAFIAPAGAVSQPTSISIRRAMPEVVPKLDPGMVNVTAPANAGYRFEPHGQRFAAPARVLLPYDSRLLPEGMAVSEIKTWFYDEEQRRWEALERAEIRHATQQIVSETMHFTFMVNAVLVTPDHPEPASFNPTSIKDLKAATPAEGLDLMELGDPGNTGAARLSLPIRLPRARGDFQPQLALVYDSAQRNGLLGVGWSLPNSAITLDTRFGVPTGGGRDRYLLDGAQLVPTTAQARCSTGGTGRVFARRQESDFARIVRCGSDDTDWVFEVTTKAGVTMRYGDRPGARLASYLDGSIAEWQLGEVLDRNGNRTLFEYDTDALTSGDPLNGEDFRMLYPRRVSFTAAPGTSSFAFQVEFKLETTGSAVATRPDVVTSARYGFKTLMRRRLGGVVVRHAGAIVREYVLQYEQGDFGKSRLSRVALFGKGGAAGGAFFAAHSVEYFSNENEPFTLDEWTLPADEDRLGASKEWSLNINHFAGIAAGPTKSSGSVGARIGYSHRESKSFASFVDINGDRIPDRLTSGAAFFGDKTSRSFSPMAPSGDPNAGNPLNPFAGPTRLPGLGSEYGNSFSLGIEAAYGPFSAATGGSLTFTDSEQYLLDADGDGLVDFVNSGSVLFNEPRGAATGCTVGQICFTQTKTLRVVGFSGDGGRTVAAGFAVDGGGLADDASRLDAGARIAQEFSPNDAVVEWIAPFAGTVDVSGTVAFTHAQPPAVGRDGVRVQLSMRDAGVVAQVSKAWGDTTATNLTSAGLNVSAGTHLYFRLSTGGNVPVAATDGGDVALEEVRFRPTVAYRCPSSNPACHSILDGARSPLYLYQLGNDFRLAGRPPLVVQSARSGRVRVTWSVVKPALVDQLRLCAVRYSQTALDVGETSCAHNLAPLADDAVVPATLVAIPGAPFTRSAEFQVTAGQQLVFRAETRMGIDVRGVDVNVHGEMLEVCDANGCRPPNALEQRYLQFDLPAQLPAHSDSSVLNGNPAPFEGYVVPRDGELILESRAPAWTCLPGPCAEITYSVRTADRVLLAHGEGRGADITASARVPVRAGERIFAEAHSEVAQTFVFGAVINAWTLSSRLATVQPDGGVVEQPIDLGPRRTWETLVPVSEPDKKQRVDLTVFAGGYHGWHFGVWGGSPNEPLDFDLLENRLVGFVAPSGTPEEQYEELKARANDPNSYERRRARVLGAMTPRQLGTATTTLLSDGTPQRVPGLKPDVASFVSTDLSAWVASDGTWHASKKGGYAAGASGSRTVDATFDIGDLRRSSFNASVSQNLGISYGGLGVSGTVSAGFSEQSFDVLDLNGDGIVDWVGRTSARLTDPASLRSGAAFTAGSNAMLRTNDDLSLSIGLGNSVTYKRSSSAGDVRSESPAVSSSVGGGISMNLGLSRGELMDINGDGLPDYVVRDGTDVVVRLNLGNGFGNPDKMPVGTWSRNDGTAAFISQFVVTDAGQSVTTEALLEAGKALSLLEALGTQEQLRRSVATSMNVNAGVVIEDWGVTANLETNLSGTEVAMIDISGDGLPDYVRRNPDRTAGNSFLAKINLGDRFSACAADQLMSA